jgi:succinate dehydrogenase / fumarate reductase flavoprotein subunit
VGKGARRSTTDHPSFKKAVADVERASSKLLGIKGKRSVDSFHRELGKSCGTTAAWPATPPASRRRSQEDPRDPARGVLGERQRAGSGNGLNQSLEKAGRVADFLELGELMCLDALERDESCGGHFREEHQTEEGEAERDDANYCLRRRVGVQGGTREARSTRKPLVFEYVSV